MKELDNNEKAVWVVKNDLFHISFTKINMAIRNRLFESAYMHDFSLGSISPMLSASRLAREALKNERTR
jgi:enolase